MCSSDLSLVDDGSFDCVPRVVVVTPPQHFTELGPREKCRGRRMSGHKPLAVLHEGKQFFALRSAQIDLSMPQKEDRVYIRETRPPLAGSPVVILGVLEMMFESVRM